MILSAAKVQEQITSWNQPKSQILFHKKSSSHDFYRMTLSAAKVIREKSRGEGSLIVQDTIENVSEPDFFFFNFLRKKKYIF